MSEGTQQDRVGARSGKQSLAAKRHAALRGFVSSYLDAPQTRENEREDANVAGPSRGRKVVVWSREADRRAATWRTLQAD